MEHKFGLSNGDEVTDNVTGFIGTVTGQVTYLLKDGRPQSVHWIDITQLMKVEPLTEQEKEDLKEKIKANLNSH